MYEAFFNLRERPFAAAPLAQRYFPAKAIEQARKTLARCIDRVEGAGLIIGPTGTGKTLLCQVLAEEFQDRFATVLLASGRLCTRRALLQAVLFELGLPYRGMEEGELRLSLMDYLSPVKQSLQGLLLVVDEAHALPWRLLEELRMISNLVRDGVPRVRLVLSGSALLEERFASPKLESFSQRLAARCYLESLDRTETFAYIRAQIRAVGGDAEQVFPDDAMQSVYRATDGIPRLINQICDHALLLANLGNCRPVTAAVVDEAWADLQQLPAPWQEGDQRGADRVIEFGGLDDRPEDERESIPFRAAEFASLSDMPNPEQHFDHIEAHLAQLEEEFQPAGTIGPEVELVFRDVTDPFNERFEEEEIVLDRYASLDADVFGRRPQVASAEGRELSALLGPYVHKTIEPKVADRGPGQNAGMIPDRVSAHLEPVAPARVSQPAAASEAASADAPASSTPHRKTVAMYRTEIERDDVEDADLIIVEDDLPENLVPTRPAPIVRRQEYRQLFAKLRRG